MIYAQKVKLMMMLCAPKWALMSHWSLTNTADGWPCVAKIQVSDTVRQSPLDIRHRLVVTRIASIALAARRGYKNVRCVHTHPSISVDRSAGVHNIGGDGGVVPRPEPDLDEGRGALGGVEPSADGVERLAVVVRLRGLDTAS